MPKSIPIQASSALYANWFFPSIRLSTICRSISPLNTWLPAPSQTKSKRCPAPKFSLKKSRITSCHLPWNQSESRNYQNMKHWETSKTFLRTSTLSKFTNTQLLPSSVHKLQITIKDKSKLPSKSTTSIKTSFPDKTFYKIF